MQLKNLIYNGKSRKPKKIITRAYGLIDKIRFCMKIKATPDIILVTGADSKYYKYLLRFIGSVFKYEEYSTLIVYDLGLTNEESKYIAISFPKIILRKFNYSDYPDYFNIKKDAGHFAWKPVILSDVFNEFKSRVMWMDAGCIITHPLYRVRNIIEKYGFYCPGSSGTIQEWTHPETFKKMRVEQIFFTKRNLGADAVAVNYNFSQVHKLVDQWKCYAKLKDYIAPEGSNRSNHRQDQSLLTILAYRYNLVDGVPFRRIGFKTHKNLKYKSEF